MELSKAVLGKKNKLLSFCAFEKKQLQKMWKFLHGRKKADDNREIGVFTLILTVYKQMSGISKKSFYMAFGSMILYGFFDAIQPYVQMLLYNTLPSLLSGSQEAMMFFSVFLSLHILCGVCQNIFWELGFYFKKKYDSYYINQRSVQKYKEIICKPRTFFVVNMPEIVSGLSDKIVAAESQLMRWCLDFCKFVAIVVVSSVSLFVVSPFLFFLIFAVAMLYAKLQYLQNEYFRGYFNKSRLFGVEISKINRDIMRNSPLIQEAITTTKECEGINWRMNQATKIYLKVLSADRRILKILENFLLIVSAIAIGVVSYNEIVQTGDIGKFALIYGAAFGLENALTSMIFHYNEQLVRLRNEIVDTEKQLVTPKALERTVANEKVDVKENKIELKNVKFSYPKTKDVTKLGLASEEVIRGEVVLKGVNLEIVSGGITVIAGMSGQGKSTLMNLIRHDYDVTAGEILLGGVNVQKLSDEAISQQIAFIDQNVHFFDNTLLYNLKYFKESASDEEVQRVLKAVGLEEDVARFKDGLFRKIGQDGKALSGGQRQRLALARIFLTNRPIIIMDEPTTGLDQVLSFKIMKALKELAQTKTVLLVTHNPTEIALADRVLVVQDGKIVADGTPMKLIETSQFLARCMTKQDVLSKQELFTKFQ